MLPTFSITVFNILVIIILNSSSDFFLTYVIPEFGSEDCVVSWECVYSCSFVYFIFFVVVESQMLCIGQKISLEEFEACGGLRVTIATTNLTS